MITHVLNAWRRVAHAMWKNNYTVPSLYGFHILSNDVPSLKLMAGVGNQGALLVLCPGFFFFFMLLYVLHLRLYLVTN